MKKIVVAEDFTDAPGARFRKEGDYSGEQFRDDILEPLFVEALKSGDKILIDLDGGYGYATSFLEEVFGGLARKYSDKKDTILQIINIKSEDEPSLIDDITEYIKNP